MPYYKTVFQSEHRRFTNIFGARFPIIRGTIRDQNCYSIPLSSPETRPEFDFSIDIPQQIEHIFTNETPRVLNVYRFIVRQLKTHTPDRPDIPSASEIAEIYPRFAPDTVIEYISGNRFACVREGSGGPIAGISIITRRNSQFSELSIAVLPRFRNQGFGSELLKRVVHQEIHAGRMVVYVTETTNYPSIRLIEQLHPDRRIPEAMLIRYNE